jgi:hypothetical protein
MNVEKHASDILLDRGVSWPVPAPWFLRILGKKKVKITVKALKLGTLYELSGLYASMGINQEDLNKDPHPLIRDHMKTVCRITAICILNSRIRIRLFSKPLARFIFHRFTANMLLEVVIFIATFSGVTAFLNTIGLIGDLKITTPKDPGPTDQGSQQKSEV